MNRRNFLGYLPAFSSLPIIGQAVLKENNNVEIIRPEPVDIITNLTDDFNGFEKCKLFLTNENNYVLAEGIIRRVNIDRTQMFIASNQSDWIEDIIVNSNIDIEGTLFKFPKLGDKKRVKFVI